LIHVFIRVIILVRNIALRSIVHSKYYSPLGRNRFGWQLEEFLLGFVSLNDDFFHNLCMNDIPVVQLQIASIAEKLLNLRDILLHSTMVIFLKK